MARLVVSLMPSLRFSLMFNPALISYRQCMVKVINTERPDWWDKTIDQLKWRLELKRRQQEKRHEAKQKLVPAFSWN